MALGNLAARVLTAVVAVPPLVLAILWEKPHAVWGIVFAATLVALHEFFAMTLEDEVERWFSLALGAAVAAGLYWWAPAMALAMPATLVASGLFYLFRFGDMATVPRRWGATVLGVLYAGALFTFLSLGKRDLGADHGGDFVLLVLMTAWFGDTGAYFAGRFLGKTKLYPAVSPGKTRAGAVGGLAGSFLAAVLMNLWLWKDLGWAHGAVITVVGGALGQCGDLVESMLKRAVGAKDSGKLLPGHGGMLDRVDAVLFIAPWAYFYLALVWAPGTR
jgi:phosphatidate cytidylyltransferase